MPAQLLNRERRQCNHARSPRLGRFTADAGSGLLDTARDGQPASIEVHVLPAHRCNLAAPQAAQDA
jgi:hypothetical protein